MFTFDIDMKKLIEMLKKLLGLSKKTAGFTLIELLVVIGILGVLAATLVATIDPFEQIKKANDTKVQNATVEFQTALVRYYTGQNAFPWWVTPGSCNTAVGGPVGPAFTIPTAVTLQTASACVTDLANIGELKPSFTQVTGVLDKVTFSQTDPSGLRPVVCYMPTSKSGKADKAAIYVDNLGTVDTATGNAACRSRGGTNDTCYWCTQ